jgi:uncharacterized damage-inducible protein DinB
MIEQIVEAWRINNRVNLMLVSHIGAAGMRCTLSEHGGCDVARQFAHMHNNRIWHLQRRAKGLAAGAKLFETDERPTRRALTSALEDSALRIEKVIRLASVGASGVRTIKRGLIPYIAYFVAHESHHRGSILLTLKQCGHPLDQKIRYGIWDWDRI